MMNTLARVSALCLLSANAYAITGPTLDLGIVTDFATAQNPRNDSLVTDGSTFEQHVTFSLLEAATVRIDMRQVGSTHWLTPRYSADLRVNSFSLLDDRQQLIGSASPDPEFTGQNLSCFTGGKCSGTFNRGYTLTAELEAGSYTMALQGVWASVSMPDLGYGLLVVGVGAPDTYFSSLTTTTAMPETSTWLMMSSGLGALAWGTRARQRR